MRKAWLPARPLRRTRMIAGACATASALLASPVRAAEPEVGRPDAYVCYGESTSVAVGASLDDLRDERDKRLRELAAGTVPGPWRAHWHCVVAELMKRLGDYRAPAEYDAAIRENPGDPGYDLWAARYYQIYRGASSVLPEAEAHYIAALRKNETHAGVTQVGSTQATTRDWAQRGLSLTYQDDGFPLLPYAVKAYPYTNTNGALPQLSLQATGTFGADTNDFWDLYDTRKLTGEYQIAAQRLGATPITTEQARTMARAPVRYGAYVGLRLRQSALGTIDFTYEHAHFYHSQITLFSSPTVFNDVDLAQFGARYRRSFDLSPLFDATIELSYGRARRVGVVENYPFYPEDYNVYGGQIALARWIGPDKLTLSGGAGYLDLPNTPYVALDQEPRGRLVRGAAIDYGIYRPLVLPALERGTFTTRRYGHRGMHIVLGGILDDERFGTTVVRRNSGSIGWSLKGYEGWSFLLSASYIWLETDVYRVSDPALGNAQVRTEAKLQRTLVDEDYEPGLPRQAVSWSWISVPIRHDLVVRGPTLFQNARAGIEIGAKIFSSGLRGTSFLVDAGVDGEYFYNIQKAVVLSHVDVRMGWPPFGPVPAYF